MLQDIITKDFEYVVIFSLVLILPKILQRAKIPSGITALFIGVIFSFIDSSLEKDQLFTFLAQIGITSLFLFAGLEVDFKELKQDRVYLSKYLTKFLIALVVIAFTINYFSSFGLQDAFILSLGIFTPSAGFILSSLHSINASEDQEYWIRSKAISKEVLSIILLFLAVQGDNIKDLLISLSFFIGLLVFLPYLFRLFFKFVSPYAPNSEIPFLIVMSLFAGVLSKELGAYYLIGAFIVGIVGARFRENIFEEGEEVLFRSLSSFFSVFLPFYFFSAGLKLGPEKITLNALYIGLAMVAIFIPLRFIMITSGMKSLLSDLKKDIYKVSLSLMPTLIFGLVISSILFKRGKVEDDVIYGLIFYTLLASLLPTVILFIVGNKKDQL